MDAQNSPAQAAVLPLSFSLLPHWKHHFTDVRQPRAPLSLINSPGMHPWNQPVRTSLFGKGSLGKEWEGGRSPRSDSGMCSQRLPPTQPNLTAGAIPCSQLFPAFTLLFLQAPFPTDRTSHLVPQQPRGARKKFLHLSIITPKLCPGNPGPRMLGLGQVGWVPPRGVGAAPALVQEPSEQGRMSLTTPWAVAHHGAADLYKYGGQ